MFLKEDTLYCPVRKVPATPDGGLKLPLAEDSKRNPFTAGVYSSLIAP